MNLSFYTPYIQDLRSQDWPLLTKPFPPCRLYHFLPADLVFRSEDIQDTDRVLPMSKEMPLELVCGLRFVKYLQTLLKDLFLLGNTLLNTCKA